MTKKLLWLLLPAALIMTSCHSSKKVAKDSANQTSSKITTINTDNGGKSQKSQDVKEQKNFTAHVRVNLSQNGNDLSTSGTLRMRHDEVIQLALVDPILGISEVARMELSPDNILFIDRFNKRYVSAGYSELPMIGNTSLDFYMIQDYFWQQAQESDHFNIDIPARTPITLDLKLSNKGEASNWEPHTTVSDKYTKTDLSRLISSMLGQ